MSLIALVIVPANIVNKHVISEHEHRFIETVMHVYLSHKYMWMIFYHVGLLLLAVLRLHHSLMYLYDYPHLLHNVRISLMRRFWNYSLLQIIDHWLRLFRTAIRWNFQLRNVLSVFSLPLFTSITRWPKLGLLCLAIASAKKFPNFSTKIKCNTY